jgi:hypothetical protein
LVVTVLTKTFTLTFGKQATVLGFDDDEAPGLYAVTTAYSNGAFSHPGKSYVDGIRLNYNNGMFGLSLVCMTVWIPYWNWFK